ncbi:MAG: hypothetical protein M0Q54_06250 [Pigmentiphaga sp.]|nr:hypothetical protein [Pigmentiphaga sp.]
MKKLTLFFGMLMVIFGSTMVYAENWAYNETRSKWEKNITPTILQFDKLTTAGIQSKISPTLGGANPNPAITSTSGEDLSEGFFAVGGGQINATDVASPENVRQAFSITDDETYKPALRFAQNSAIVDDGYKAGKFLGYVNINWYIPLEYTYRVGYHVSFRDTVYNPATYGLSFLVYGEEGTQLGTTQNLNTIGLNVAVFTQTDTRPFRFKMSIPNTGDLIAYYKTPVLLLNSDTEPTIRTITVDKTGNGTVTAAYPTVRDQDTQTFTFAPESGYRLGLVKFDDGEVTPIDNLDGTYTFTTPLLKANGSLDVEFSVITGMKDNVLRNYTYSFQHGAMCIEGLQSGEKVDVFDMSGQLLHSVIVHDVSVNFPVSRGMYIIKVGRQSFKVAL